MANQSKKPSPSSRKPASNKSKSAAPGGKNTRKKDANDMDFILSEILYIILILFFIILFLGNFLPSMVIFGPLAAFLRRMFGIGGYFLPVLGIWYLFWEIRHKDKKYRSIKLAGVVILFFGIIIFTHLLGGKEAKDFPKGFALFEGLYKAGAASNGGGVGGIAACALRSGLTFGISLLISIIIIIISLILFTGRSFFKAVGAFFKFMFGPDEEIPKEKKKKRAEKEPDKRQVSLEEAEKYEPIPDMVRDEEYFEEDAHIKPKSGKRPKMFNFIIGKDVPDSDEEAKKAAQYFEDKERELAERDKAEIAKTGEKVPFAFDLNKSEIVDEEGSSSHRKDGNEEKVPEIGNYREEFHKIIEDFEENPQEEGFYDGDEPLIDAPLESSEEAKSAGVIASGDNAEIVKKHETTYVFPPLELLNKNLETKDAVSKEEMLRTSKKLEETLASFGVTAKVVQINRGPTVTRYEVSPGTGVKVSKIANLADDIALNLAASGIRIEAPIPGKAAVGIEVPNRTVSQVLLRDVLDTEDFKNAPSKISFGLGQDIAGNTIIPDIAKMPHLLIAGATGSGKSVCVNTIITSIIYKASPEDVKLILVDPKMVELNVYNGIPHLMLPVVTDPKKAAGALNWGVREMLLRYQMFAEKNVRDMDGYNSFLEEHPEAEGEKMSRIVIIVDELADLMMAAPGEVEDAICRLAQMARAAGMHLIIATQRPSVDVITGVIKANIPSRIAFSVSSGVDSRTIIDMVGAEKLIGKGDMLFAPQGLSKPLRVQGAFVSDKEVENIVNFVKNNADGEVTYDKKIIDEITASSKVSASSDGNGDSDEFYNDAVELVVEKGKASASMLQRQFRIGYNRAARLIEELEANRIIGPEDGSKPRKVLLTKEEYYRLDEDDAE